MKVTKKNEIIAELNDALRKDIFNANIKGKVVLTAGVSALPFAYAVIETVQNFNEFTEDNDPYEEHDFGQFFINNMKFFWKIDYYDSPKMEYGSSDPYNEEKTFRVLTIMKAEEY